MTAILVSLLNVVARQDYDDDDAVIECLCKMVPWPQSSCETDHWWCV